MSKRSTLVLLASLALSFGAGSAFAQNSLDVNTDAAIVGTFGLEVLVPGGSSNGVYVADTTPDNELVYRVEFRIGHNGLAMNDGTGHNVLLGRQLGEGNIIRVTMAQKNGQYKILCRIKKTGGGTAFCGQFTFAPVNTRVGFDYIGGAGDGVMTLRKGDNQQFSRTDFDSDFLIDTVRFGMPKNGDAEATTVGSFYLDDFSSFRTLAP